MPSGHKAFLVQNPRDVELLLMHNRTYAAEIGHAVSSRKRVEIVAKAKALGVKVTNAKARITTKSWFSIWEDSEDMFRPDVFTKLHMRSIHMRSMKKSVVSSFTKNGGVMRAQSRNAVRNQGLNDWYQYIFSFTETPIQLGQKHRGLPSIRIFEPQMMDHGWMEHISQAFNDVRPEFLPSYLPDHYCIASVLWFLHILFFVEAVSCAFMCSSKADTAHPSYPNPLTSSWSVNTAFL